MAILEGGAVDRVDQFADMLSQRYDRDVRTDVQVIQELLEDMLNFCRVNDISFDECLETARTWSQDND